MMDNHFVFWHLSLHIHCLLGFTQFIFSHPQIKISTPFQCHNKYNLWFHQDFMFWFGVKISLVGDICFQLPLVLPLHSSPYLPNVNETWPISLGWGNLNLKELLKFNTLPNFPLTFQVIDVKMSRITSFVHVWLLPWTYC